jgi:GT2 family glycosyltransferase
METRAPAVVAIVVTTDYGLGLEATVASLVDQDYPSLSVLVVANGQSEQVPGRIAAVAPDVYVRQLDVNRGFAAACNEGALLVEGSAFFLFCHDDIRLDSDAVSIMVEAAYRTNAGIVTPKFVDYEDPLILLHVGQTSDRFGAVKERSEIGEIDHGQQDLERDVFVAPGGAMLIRTDLFTTLRGFDPLIPALGEDLDICWRAQSAGARILVAPAAKVAHRESIARGERIVNAVGVRRSSRQSLQRRHQLLVVATGWGFWQTLWILSQLLVLDVIELIVSGIGRDRQRVRAILGSWRWLAFHRGHIRSRRKQRKSVVALSDTNLRRLQVGGANRIKAFANKLVREGYDTARGMLPEEDEQQRQEDRVDAGVGFGSSFAENDEFDEISENPNFALRHRPSKVFTSFRSQILLIGVVASVWGVATRNLVSMHLPLIGRLAPLDSWWSTWRHFFASWSPSGVGTGTPGMPGYGLIAFFGTFVFGRMGTLPRIMLIMAVPIGAIGIARLLKYKVSNRARILASIGYLTMPLGANMIAQGRIDVLVIVATAPFIVRRIFELLDVPGYRTQPYTQSVPFGHRGWRTSESGQRMMLVMLTALSIAMAPAVAFVPLLVVAGVWLARQFEPDNLDAPVYPWRLLGSILGTTVWFLLPLAADTLLAGRRALEVFGLRRGPWSSPDLWAIVRGADGGFGQSWWFYLLPLAAMLGLLLSRNERRATATKLASIYMLALLLTILVSRGLLGPLAPDLDVLMALQAVLVVTLVGVGISSLENDVKITKFGWTQVAAGALVGAVCLAAFPLILDSSSGRFNLPSTSVAESLGQLSSSPSGGFRVLWLGDPTVLPLGGWSVAPGVAAATSMNGLPGGANFFAPPDSGTSDVILTAVESALKGTSVQLGAALAEAGISTVVVLNSAAPNFVGVQSSPVRTAPNLLLAALGHQTDLSLSLQTASEETFSNLKFHGIVSAQQSGRATTPIFSNVTFAGEVPTNATVHAALAPAGAFALEVNGVAVSREIRHGWGASYATPSSSNSVNIGTLVLHQFPLNGLLAAFTLMLWLVVWLGFGWIQRLEWVFTFRSSRKIQPRRAKEVQ